MKPSIGRIVHYVAKRPFPNGQSETVHVPAIITAVWTDTCVNLQVFSDGTNSHANGVSTAWETSRTLDGSATPQVGTWHWPEKVE